MNAGVVVEGNFFDNVEKPARTDVGGHPEQRHAASGACAEPLLRRRAGA
jgi:hypothetical protein